MKSSNSYFVNNVQFLWKVYWHISHFNVYVHLLDFLLHFGHIFISAMLSEKVDRYQAGSQSGSSIRININIHFFFIITKIKVIAKLHNGVQLKKVVKLKTHNNIKISGKQVTNIKELNPTGVSQYTRQWRGDHGNAVVFQIKLEGQKLITCLISTITSWKGNWDKSIFDWEWIMKQKKNQKHWRI